VNEERGEESQAGSLGAGSVRAERKKMEWTPREHVGGRLGARQPRAGNNWSSEQRYANAFMHHLSHCASPNYTPTEQAEGVGILHPSREVS
jgi:hypothetical protein